MKVYILPLYYMNTVDDNMVLEMWHIFEIDEFGLYIYLYICNMNVLDENVFWKLVSK